MTAQTIKAEPSVAVRRLRVPMPADEAWSWLATFALTVLCFLIRLVDLANPNKLVFDETYYAKDAWSLVHRGYEAQWSDKANGQLLAGTVDVPTAAAFVVHPPLGKWLIGLGELMFGMNSFGWRFMSVVFGSLMVASLVRLGRRLTRSTMIGLLAAFLLTVDGLHFAMSRIALLDIFQASFLVMGVACMVADRDWFRERLARHLEAKGLPDLQGGFGPFFVWRPWRLAAGVLLGCAIACKWNSAFLVAVMCLLTLAWDVRARRMAGAGSSATWWSILGDGAVAFYHQVVVAFGVYLASWSGWILTRGGWDRTWGESNPHDPAVKTFGTVLGSLLHYHREISDFHNGDFIKHATHPYEAHPAGWLVVARIIGIDANNDIKPGVDGCPQGQDTCLSVIVGMGTPLLWWAAAVALVACAWFWIARRDWRFAVPLCAALSTYVPWWFFAERPLFYFYAITIIPFTCLGLAMCLGRILGPGLGDPGFDPGRRQSGAIIVGTLVALIAADFAFIYPILADVVIPRWAWSLRTWIAGWI